jgi:hypothetical protein
MLEHLKLQCPMDKWLLSVNDFVLSMDWQESSQDREQQHPLHADMPWMFLKVLHIDVLDR